MELYQYNKEIDQYLDPETGEVLEGIGYNQDVLKSVAVKVKMSQDKQLLIKAELDRLKDLLDNEKRKEENIKSFGLLVLDHMGEKSIDFGTFKVGARNNPGRIEIDPTADVKDYTTVEMVEKIKVDKKKLKEDIEAGKEIRGVHLIKDKSLTIK